MKKLMIAAAAAMAGAASFGGLCDPEAVSDGCSVYNIKFTFKTLAAKTACAQGARWLVTDAFPGDPRAIWYRNAQADQAAAAAAAAANRAVIAADYVGIANACATAGLIQQAAQRQVFWMDNATRKFEGIAWQCRSACFEGRMFRDCDLTNNGRLNYVIWEKKNSLAISLPVYQVRAGTANTALTGFDGAVRTEYFSLDAQRDMLIGRYGKKAQKVAAYWTPRLLRGQSIRAAGFGTYDVNNLRTKSISGNAVGMIMPIQDGEADPCGIRGRIFCALGFMCVEWMDWCCDGCYAGVQLVPASGTWSLKYNSSATKKANKDKATLASFVPAYMFYANSAWDAFKALDPWLHTDGYYWWDDTIGLFYRGGAAGANTADDILDYIADGASKVIDIVSDGAYDAENKKYTYVEKDAYGNVKYGEDGTPVTKDYELDDSGVLPGDLFGDAPVAEEE